MALIAPPTKNILPGPNVTIAFTAAEWCHLPYKNEIRDYGGKLFNRGYNIQGWIDTNDNPVQGHGKLLGHIHKYKPHTIVYTKGFARGRMHKHLLVLAGVHRLALHTYASYTHKHLGKEDTAL